MPPHQEQSGIIGEPGVGQDAIVEGLAQRISDGDFAVPRGQGASFPWIFR